MEEIDSLRQLVKQEERVLKKLREKGDRDVIDNEDKFDQIAN